MLRRTFLLASATAAAGTVATALPFGSMAAESITKPNAGAARRVAPKPTPKALTLPNVVLRTHQNKEVRLYEDLLKGKIFMINMFFVTCTDGTCPVATGNLSRVQPLLGDRLGRDMFMYSISLDPARDTPTQLKNYAAHFNVKPGWEFLTGNPDDIDKLRRALGYWDPDPKKDAQKTTHAGIAMMGNEPLDRWVGCPTLADPKEIRRVLSYLDWPKGWSKARV